MQSSTVVESVVAVSATAAVMTGYLGKQSAEGSVCRDSVVGSVGRGYRRYGRAPRLRLAGERGKIRPPPHLRIPTTSLVSLMSSPASARASANASKHNPVLCASAVARLLWAVAGLLLLWTTVLWALH